MSSSRFELDLTRNSIRRLKSIQNKLRDASSQWSDIDGFISGELDRKADDLDKLISEIQNRKS